LVFAAHVVVQFEFHGLECLDGQRKLRA
jgi:hypothetical protein